MNHHFSKQQGGVTLVEMMVAVAIMSILALTAAEIIGRNEVFQAKLTKSGELEELRQELRITIDCSSTQITVPAICSPSTPIAVRGRGGRTLITIPASGVYTKRGSYYLKASCGATPDIFKIEKSTTGTAWQDFFSVPFSCNGTPIVTAAEIASAYQFKVFNNAPDTYNFRYAQERYIYGRTEEGNAGWYFIMPTGKIYRWNTTLGDSKLIGRVSPSYASSATALVSLIEAALPNNLPSNAAAIQASLHLTYYAPYDNTHSWGDKWLYTPGGAWYFMLPTGTLYPLAVSGYMQASSPVAKLDASIYANPLLMTNP